MIETILVIESMVENKTCLIRFGVNKKLVTDINCCIYYVTVIILISHFLNMHTTWAYQSNIYNFNIQNFTIAFSLKQERQKS